MIHIRKGLNLPLKGAPQQAIDASKNITTYAVQGADYLGMKPTMMVNEGQQVLKGQALFEDKKNPGVLFTSPVAGTVKAVNRGDKRVFQSVVIEKTGDTQFNLTHFQGADLDKLTREQVTGFLCNSGLWTALRQRPYSKIPAPGKVPHSLFITATDTNPHAPDPVVVIHEQQDFFVAGLRVLHNLTDGKVYLCKGPKGMIPGYDLDFVTLSVFSGPHPAGLPGTHIHFLDPASEKKHVWYINYQDVISIGKLATTGVLDTSRVISLAGPMVKNPRLLKVNLGADVEQITRDELHEGVTRVISGSVLSGRQVAKPNSYLGRYHNQVSVLREGNERIFLGWQTPGFDKFSLTRSFASTIKVMTEEKPEFDMTTSTEGSKRAMVPIGVYEEVVPLDILPTQLLRSLLTNDDDMAVALGALELDEEDLALCTFACPSKYEYGKYLRNTLTRIEKEG